MPSKTKEKTPFAVHDVANALKNKSKLAFEQFSDFNLGSAGVFVAVKGISPWELHPDSDEFLHVLEGEVTIKLLGSEGPTDILVKAGTCFIVPKGVWHRHEVAKHLRELFVTPGSTEYSELDDPRKAGKIKKKPAAGTSSKPTAKTAPTDLPELIRSFCLSFPETHEDHPWGYPAFKVKNKTFVWMSFKEQGINLSLKLPTSSLSALALPFVKPSGYGLERSGWITAELERDDTRLSAKLIESWITESFRSVAPKTLLKEMDKAAGPEAKTAGRNSQAKG